MKTFVRGALILSLGLLAWTPVAEAKLDSKEWSKLSKKARRAGKAGDAYTVASLIPEIAADDSVRAVELIGKLAMLRDGDVYNAARDSLSGINEPKAVAHMCLKLSKGSGNENFRVLLADAFSNRSDDPTIEALNSALGDRYPQVVRASVDAILKRRDKRSIDALIDLLERYEKKKLEGLNVNKVRDGLKSLTGESFETAIDWRSWWTPRKDGFNVPEPSAADEKKKVGGTVSRNPKFFGSEIKSRRIVFVIDVSGSMQASDPEVPDEDPDDRPETGAGKGENKPEPKAPSRVRLVRAKFQLSRAIKALPKGSKFTVVAYSGAGAMGQLPKKNDPIEPKVGGIEWLSVWNKKLMPSSNKAVKSALEFVEKFEAKGATFTYRAIRTALQIKGADNIILLSDGAPNDPDGNKQMTTDEILKEVATLNNFRKVRIDTFGFDAQSPMGRGRSFAGPQNPFVEFLKKLAQQNGGKFTKIR